MYRNRNRFLGQDDGSRPYYTEAITGTLIPEGPSYETSDIGGVLTPPVNYKAPLIQPASSDSNTVMVGDVGINAAAVNSQTVAQALKINAQLQQQNQTPTLAVPASGTTSFTAWLNQTTGGLKNEYLLLGVAALGALGLVLGMKKKR